MMMMMTSNLSEVGILLNQVNSFTPDQVHSFQSTPLYGLLFEKLLHAISMNQFNGGRYLDDLTTVLIWMLLGTTSSPFAVKEKQQLLSLLRVSTTDDKFRFHNPNLQQFLHRVCGQEGDQVSSIAWFYREYAMRWMEIGRAHV